MCSANANVALIRCMYLLMFYKGFNLTAMMATRSHPYKVTAVKNNFLIFIIIVYFFLNLLVSDLYLASADTQDQVSESISGRKKMYQNISTIN